LIDWMTSEEPGARPSSARQALARLERAERIGAPTEVYEPTFERERRQAVTEPAVPPPYEPPTSSYARTGSNRSRWGAIAAIVGVIAALVIAALVLSNSGGDQEGNGRTAAARATNGKNGQSKSKQLGAGAGATAAATESSQATAAEAPEASEANQESEVAESSEPETAAPAEGGSESGASLNEEGYALIQAGEYEAAVPVLEEAVASYPEGSEELDYAYALFNLGHALRLSGRSEEAIPILERRLEIPDQTSTVEEELEAARAEAAG
jgi:tetratricopeptide (TPR) repeat protein